MLTCSVNFKPHFFNVKGYPANVIEEEAAKAALKGVGYLNGTEVNGWYFLFFCYDLVNPFHPVIIMENLSFMRGTYLVFFASAVYFETSKKNEAIISICANLTSIKLSACSNNSYAGVGLVGGGGGGGDGGRVE